VSQQALQQYRAKNESSDQASHPLHHAREAIETTTTPACGPTICAVKSTARLISAKTENLIQLSRGFKDTPKPWRVIVTGPKDTPMNREDDQTAGKTAATLSFEPRTHHFEAT
jgi:hypothetical protein